ncbi:MAG: hypothetical protein WCT37_00890 [Patescibacteria group bacterium]|jgi:hypothetical protein
MAALNFVVIDGIIYPAGDKPTNCPQPTTCIQTFRYDRTAIQILRHLAGLDDEVFCGHKKLCWRDCQLDCPAKKQMEAALKSPNKEETLKKQFVKIIPATYHNGGIGSTQTWVNGKKSTSVGTVVAGRSYDLGVLDLMETITITTGYLVVNGMRYCAGQVIRLRKGQKVTLEVKNGLSADYRCVYGNLRYRRSLPGLA